MSVKNIKFGLEDPELQWLLWKNPSVEKYPRRVLKWVKNSKTLEAFVL